MALHFKVRGKRQKGVPKTTWKKMNNSEQKVHLKVEDASIRTKRTEPSLLELKNEVIMVNSVDGNNTE